MYPDAATDTRPWFRQFWPWFLIVLPSVVVIASFYTLYLAILHSDDLVVDQYYKDGLAINRQLEQKQRAATLGITARFTITPQQATVELAGPVASPTLELALSHPMEADRDFGIVLQQVAPGIYSGVLDTPVRSRWHWQLRDPDDPTWHLDGVLSAADLLDADSS
ncbi:FixH family protein [Kineobactrum salinum]|uniref:FixH family protein n=1 Tax=Kineobactrum salinum TaxID=2708301 RepID=A0A6C0U5R6_9GAMM|nr:FixH family protein [Kineobactrum salinum]QIB67512.1 FixH family protein [Kineobactrum salinum]